jgi:hypothetical protein
MRVNAAPVERLRIDSSHPRVSGKRHQPEPSMDTANLQLEGLHLALAALLAMLRDSGVASSEQIEAALADAERLARADPANADLSPANVEAKAFPIRLLRLANQRPGQDLTFSDMARLAGETKDGLDAGAPGFSGREPDGRRPPHGESRETLGVLKGVAPTQEGVLSSEEIGDIAAHQEAERDA